LEIIGFPISTLKSLPHSSAKQISQKKAFTGLWLDLERQNIADSARQTAQNSNWKPVFSHL